MQALSTKARQAGQRIAFVPTMGFLHQGHVSLLQKGRALGELLVLSIFVNPLQFGANEDLSRYPRDEAGDLAQAQSAGTDIAFCPDATAMYPAGFQTQVSVEGLSQGLCGEYRPGHFTGVATVVLKLCNIVKPDFLLLGEKDFQQLQVVRRMVRDLSLDLRVVGYPLLRAEDGLALSSRNAYLSPDQRKSARCLSAGLFAAAARFQAGERDPTALLAAVQEVIEKETSVRLQYLELRDQESLVLVQGPLLAPAVLALSAYVGKTRLIDNILLESATFNP